MEGQDKDLSILKSASLPLAGFHLYSTSSMDEANAYHAKELTPLATRSFGMGLADLPLGYDPLSFVCTHNAFPLQKIVLNAISYNAPMRFAHLSQIETDLSLIFVLDGYCHVKDGTGQFSVGPGEMFVLNAGQTIDARTSANFKDIVVKIDSSAVMLLLTHMVDRSTSVPLRFNSNPCPGNPSAASLLRFVRLLCTEIDSMESVIQFEHVSRSFEKTLLTVLLTSIPHNYSPWIQETVPAAAPHYVVKAERFIRENLHATVTLDDIIYASGTGRRSLQKSFRQFRRQTPMLYLKECRLQYARKQLKDDTLARKSIAEIAQEAGFDHPSKFSLAYRTRFDELPSETRRRLSMSLV